MTDSFAVIGDIHGDATRLRRALADSRVNQRQVIFSGDYIDRGPDSREVIEMLVTAQREHPDWVFLEGNHEAMLCRLQRREISAGSFVRAGGHATVLSYVLHGSRNIETLFSAIPHHHWQFFSRLKSHWMYRDLIVTHAGIPRLSSHGVLGIHSWSREDVLWGGNEWLFHLSEELPVRVVFGHYRQSSGKPFITDRVACIDTGCGSGGPLTALLIPEWEYVQF